MTDGTTDEKTPQAGTPGAEDSPQMFEVNGDQVSLDELQKGYMRQSDYTKKAQDLAEQRKELESLDSKEEVSPDEAQLYEWNKSKGFVTKDDLELIQNQQKLEIGFHSMLQENPDLKKFESAIRTIQQAEGGSFEEIAIKHGFTSEDKLEKAKSSRGKMVGSDNREPTPHKSVVDMSPDERESYKKKHGITHSAGLVGSGTI